MDKIISGLFNVNEPIGERLTQILYYLGIVYILWMAIKRMWFWLTYFDNDFTDALWGLIKTPLLAILAIVAWRVMTEFYIAVFKIRDSVTADKKEAA